MKEKNQPAWTMQTDAVVNYGMTLRDYFANSAMQGLLSNSTVSLTLPEQNESLTTLVYKIADAMLKQREL